MTRKQWVWITIVIALIHLALVWLLTPISGEIIFSRFEGNPYDSSTDPFLVGAYFFLYIPYLLIIFSGIPVGLFPPALFLLWLGNSLVYGLIGAWMISKLPFMRKKNLQKNEARHVSRDKIY
jgi:hypothetical protein